MGVVTDSPVIVVFTFVLCIPNSFALSSFIESTGNENCEPDIVLPADIYRFFCGSNVSEALPPTPLAPIVITEGVLLVARV